VTEVLGAAPAEAPGVTEPAGAGVVRASGRNGGGPSGAEPADGAAGRALSLPTVVAGQVLSPPTAAAMTRLAPA
jgi:hypothetical protein